ncbi:nad-binding protein [Diplodia corticola]|uniref:Nad-binding protein n=1 Tax=Diplodia corticola TaxID=236234 RepID=A0A1J9QRU7_9PEZI|nr:nad-binding protein [Diplodia corticola]OJD31145.1 nad-binding protein [Diplodia corticola]
MDGEQQHILITGGCGFLGRHIVSAFLSQHPSHEYTVIDVSPLPTSPPDLSNVHYAQVDIRDREAVRRAFAAARPTAVVHSAGIVPSGPSRYSQQDRRHVFEVNVDGTRNVLDAAMEYGSVRAFVYTSSSTVLGDDLSREVPNASEQVEDASRKRWVYGESKTHAENLVLAANCPSTAQPFLTTALRPSVLFGPGDTNLVPPIHALIASRVATAVTLGSGFNLYDVTYVTNAADAHVLAVQNLLLAAALAATAPEPLPVSSGGGGDDPSAAGLPIFITNASPIPFRDFCRAVWARFGHHPPLEVRVPVPAARALGSVADAVSWALGGGGLWRGPHFSLSRGAVEDAVGVRYASGERARRLLGYVPRIGLAEGLDLACEASRFFLGLFRV